MAIQEAHKTAQRSIDFRDRLPILNRGAEGRRQSAVALGLYHDIEDLVPHAPDIIGYRSATLRRTLGESAQNGSSISASFINTIGSSDVVDVTFLPSEWTHTPSGLLLTAGKDTGVKLTFKEHPFKIAGDPTTSGPTFLIDLLTAIKSDLASGQQRFHENLQASRQNYMDLINRTRGSTAASVVDQTVRVIGEALSNDTKVVSFDRNRGAIFGITPTEEEDFKVVRLTTNVKIDEDIAAGLAISLGRNTRSFRADYQSELASRNPSGVLSLRFGDLATITLQRAPNWLSTPTGLHASDAIGSAFARVLDGTTSPKEKFVALTGDFGQPESLKEETLLWKYPQKTPGGDIFKPSTS